MEMFWEEVKAIMKKALRSIGRNFVGLCGVLLHENTEVLTYFASNLKKILETT